MHIWIIFGYVLTSFLSNPLPVFKEKMFQLIIDSYSLCIHISWKLFNTALKIHL
jgi:hypothetical protein